MRNVILMTSEARLLPGSPFLSSFWSSASFFLFFWLAYHPYASRAWFSVQDLQTMAQCITRRRVLLLWRRLPCSKPLTFLGCLPPPAGFRRANKTFGEPALFAVTPPCFVKIMPLLIIMLSYLYFNPWQCFRCSLQLSRLRACKIILFPVPYLSLSTCFCNRHVSPSLFQILQ